MNIDLKDIYSNNRTIIDIRAEYEYLSGNIDGSINIVENKLLLNPEYYLDKNKEYIIYCQQGYRSKKISNYLISRGYKVYSLNGGYQAYLNRR